MQILYTIAIHIYGLAIRTASLFNEKAKLWVNGRKNYFATLDNTIKTLHPNAKRAWFHASSLGEFEQGRPVIEAFRKIYPETQLILTFFSPSGYQVRKNYAGADVIVYLPLDTKANAEKFIAMIKPDIAFFVKYDYWFNVLQVLQQKQIPSYVISAIFRENSMFFKWYGKWARKYLNGFANIFVQDENSKKRLETINVRNAIMSGDTRFDRVYAIASQPQTIEVAKAFAANETVLVAGSTWQPDENILAKLLQNKPQLKCVIVPHEIGQQRINALLEKFNSNAVLFSEASVDSVKNYQVLIINKIGFLSHLYQYGQLAYIGGGFGAGIHNTLEAAVFGLPLFFGANYKKFKEAEDLIVSGGAQVIHNAEELIQSVNTMLHDKQKLQNAANACAMYVKNNVGATELILKQAKNLNETFAQN